MHLALVLETERFELLIDTRELWRPACVHVRRGDEVASVWLGEEISFIKAPRLGPAERERVLALVREHVDDLLTAWYSLREDVRRGRLGRNLLVE